MEEQPRTRPATIPQTGPTSQGPGRATVQELAARLYLRKRDGAARVIAGQQGAPYGSEEVSRDQEYAMFWQRDPDADEQQAWLEAVQAMTDGGMPPEKALAHVIETVYPARIAVVEGGGRTQLADQIAFVQRALAWGEKRGLHQGRTPGPETEETTPAPPVEPGEPVEEGY